MRYFITGAAGFIGSHFVRGLLAGDFGPEPSQVTVYDKLTYAGNLANLAEVDGDARYSFVLGDICDGPLLDHVLPGHDVVVNFAAETHVDRSIHGPQDFVVTNVVGTQTLLDACLRHGIARTVHIGTDEVYGSIDSGSWDEQQPLKPNSPYSAAKAAAELLVRAYFVTYGLNVLSTRCSNNYGPYQFPEKVVPLFVTNLIDGQKVPLYGDGLNVRDWLHVDDHCRGIALVIEKGQAGESYNIGGGLELTNRELTERVLDAMGADWAMVQPVEDRKGHDRRYSVDDSRLRAMGYQPRHRFEDGLAETVQWYRDHEAWWRPLKASAAL
ncbi:MAG: dTDP-glucose 4,6-dehydratase [Actinomycetota bacterium]|nr:dTDP-glucose 4,6-dehydratase [Actinomycetota bacterium]